MKKKYLGVIPARGGSKGIPKKNIVNLNGKPLIAYTIECANTAIKKGYLDRCIVSTDSEEIASISRSYGADVPFLRPDFLGGDKVKSIDVILHALKFVELSENKYDAVVLLQPTSPLRTVEDLINGIDLYDKGDNDSLISVYEDVKANGFNYYRMGNNNKGVAEHKEHNLGLRRQDMKPMYVRNGAIYISDVTMLKNRNLIIGDAPSLFVMPKARSIDLDSMIDLFYIETLIKNNLS